MVREWVPPPVKRLAKRMLSPVPRHLSKNHIPIDRHGQQQLRASLETHFYKAWRSQDRYTQRQYDEDMALHLHGALKVLRCDFIPWLDKACPLRGRRVLEVGCGTGSSTVALAEQGAKVTGIDINEPSIQVASDRCRVYGVDARLVKHNADAIASFGANAFDLVVFSASLEHMTIPERLAALNAAWQIIPVGGALGVFDTPNRLWYFDQHTSWLPFYHWLPNDLAFQYAKFSPRQNFRELYGDYSEAAEQHFLRRGRGVSFHEFDLAIKPAPELRVIGSRSSYRGALGQLLGNSAPRKYKAMLMSFGREIHHAFFDPNLELVIERN